MAGGWNRRGFIGAAMMAGMTAVAKGAASDAIVLAIEAKGELPGFRITEARPFLSDQMAKTGVAGWRFTPGREVATAPDRVEWRFELLPYATGNIRQVLPMTGAQKLFGARRLVSAEARLYLGGQYQTVTLDQAAIQGGADDPALGALVASITQNLLGETGAYHAIDMTKAHGVAAPLR